MIKTFSKKEESKLEEGNIKTIDNEQEVEDITVAVSTEVPDEVDKIEKDDKQAFEEFKTMYKGVIDIKCRQDFGDCEDEKLWEDTAKELFLQSKNYILVGDEYKAKEDLDDQLEKIEESKEIINEARLNDVESRINRAKEWKQKVEDAVEATDLEEIVDEILEFVEDIKDNNFAGEDLYSGMSDVLDNGDAEARGPVTYVRSVKRDMQNILDDFIDNYEQAFNEESLEESVQAVENSKLTEDIEIIDINKNNNEPNELTTNVVEELERINFNTKGNAKIRVSYVKDNIVKVSVMHNSNNSMVIKIGNAIINRFNTLEDYEIGETFIQPALGGKWGGKALYRIHIICNNDVSDEETPEGALSFKEFEREVKYYDDHNKIDKDEMKTLYYDYYLNNLKLEISELVSDYLNLDESKKLEKSSKTLPLSESNDPEFNYKMLDRLKSDCDYFLGNGNRAKKHLWAGNCEAQIAKMREIYNSLEEKPEWLSQEDIDNYEKEMCSKQLEETKTFSEEDIDKTIKEYLVKTNGIFTDDSIYDIVEELCGESDIDKMPKDLVDQVTAKVYKDNKIEEKRKLPQAEIDQLRKNMRQVLKDHGKFDSDEELEDYIEEFMPMWIEAQENLGTPVTLEESSDEEFKNRYPKSFKAWKEANPNKPDKEIIDILRAMEYNGELHESKRKEIKTEDQYEMERRKGRPNLDKIAKEVFEYDDYYIDVVDNFRSEREFIIEHIAEVASEYNLKEQAAWAVMEKIYKMAKEAKSKDEKVEEAKSITDAEIAELDKFIDDLENEYPTPKEGASDTEIGEWRRCWNNLAFAFYNNGDKAGVGFENGQEKKFDDLYAASKPFGNELAQLVDTIYGTKNETTYQNKLYRALIKFKEIVEARETKLTENDKLTVYANELTDKTIIAELSKNKIYELNYDNGKKDLVKIFDIVLGQAVCKSILTGDEFRTEITDMIKDGRLIETSYEV